MVHPQKIPTAVTFSLKILIKDIKLLLTPLPRFITIGKMYERECMKYKLLMGALLAVSICQAYKVKVRNHTDQDIKVKIEVVGIPKDPNESYSCRSAFTVPYHTGL